MINQVMGFFKPNSTRSAILSSCISMLASNIGAKSVATGTVLLSSLMCLPHNQAAKALTEAFVSVMFVPKVIQVAKVTKAAPRAVAAQNTVHKPANNPLLLHSFVRKYNCVFSGTVTCGEGPCQTGEVQVHLTSRANPDIVRTAMLKSDGRYELNVPLNEALNEHVDWWIVVDSPESSTTQIHGREILMEDSTIQIEEPIRLL